MKFLGVDIFLGMLVCVVENFYKFGMVVELWIVDFQVLLYLEVYFDLVMGVYVIEYLLDLEVVVWEMVCVLKLGGYLLIIFICWFGLGVYVYFKWCIYLLLWDDVIMWLDWFGMVDFVDLFLGGNLMI